MPAEATAADAGKAGPNPSRRRYAIAAVLVLAFVGAANAYLIVRSRDAIVADLSRTPPRPYVIVLGTLVLRGGAPSRELVARLEVARQLYQSGSARRIIVSGMVRRWYDEPDSMAAWLESHGVAPGDVVIDRGGFRTAASMADAAAAGVQSLLVVSQGYHLPRALYLARHAGIDAIGVPAPQIKRTVVEAIHLFVRETTARAEIIVEVALRGVRGLPPGQIPTGPIQ